MLTLARRSLGQLARTALSLPLPIPTRGWCCVCNGGVATFLPYAPSGLSAFRLPPLMVALQVVGSDVSRFTCPRCLSHDRERHLVLFLRATRILGQLPGMRILHMAPERNLSRMIAEAQPQRYVQGDLFPVSPGVERIDLLQIPHPADSFDLVIANHVLEHVADDRAALAEIVRVLAPGGHAVLQTPYSLVLTATFEDVGIRSANARLHAYGQEDHVRLYGADIFRRFAASGLVDRCVTHAQALPGIDPYLHGVNAAEPLFLFEKP